MISVMVEEGSDVAVVGQVAAARSRYEELSAGRLLLLQDEDLYAIAGGARCTEEAGGARSDDDEVEEFTGPSTSPFIRYLAPALVAFWGRSTRLLHLDLSAIIIPDG